MDRAQGNDLAPIFEDLSQIEKLTKHQCNSVGLKKRYKNESHSFLHSIFNCRHRYVTRQTKAKDSKTKSKSVHSFLKSDFIHCTRVRPELICP